MRTPGRSQARIPQRVSAKGCPVSQPLRGAARHGRRTAARDRADRSA